MRRAIAVVAAIVLAGIGTYLLVNYVQGAEERRLERIETVEVLVVDTEIPAGTRLDLDDDLVVFEQIPRNVAAVGVLSDPADLVGLVAAIDLIPGEQLIVDRVMTEEDYLALQTEEVLVEVPPDLLELTVSLTPDRVLGGEIEPGDLVAVFASFEPFNASFVEPTGLEGEIPVVVPTTIPGQTPEEGPTLGAQTPNSTKIILHYVLVSNVQAEELPPTPAEGEEVPEDAPDLAPTGNLLITLALEPVAAERLVFTAEHGAIWLAREGAEVDTTDTEIQTRATVYENEPE